jgi:hypothetical protein
MKNLGFNAPTGAPLQIATIVPTINKLALIQNNDPTNDLRVGFTLATTNATDGFLVGPGEILPIPFDGNVGAIWVLGITGIIPGVIGLL